MKTQCCEPEATTGSNGHEEIHVRKTKFACGVCEGYAEREKAKPIAVLSCEGACLRGEISRRAANLLCHHLAREKTVRICLGGAFTKDTGQRALVRGASRVIALEGCGTDCASRMMEGVIGGLAPQVIRTDALAQFDRKLFGANELPDEEITAQARRVAEQVAAMI
jgi:uncharacterized metal-binding protein